MQSPSRENQLRSEADAPRSSFLDAVSVLILTYNESQNIGRTLDALRRFQEVVVLDSFSTDDTLDIARSYSNVRIEQRHFDGHASQWTYGLEECGITKPWLLALDADYVLTPELVGEMAELAGGEGAAGYSVRFDYCVLGRPLAAALYPGHVVLFRREVAKFIQDGHTQRIVVDGRIVELAGRILHDDRKPHSRWLSSQLNYARLEAEHLLSIPRKKLRMSDRLRLMAWPAPLLVFIHTLVFKRCILDGWRGWLYVMQRTLAEILIALEIVDRKVRNSSKRE